MPGSETVDRRRSLPIVGANTGRIVGGAGVLACVLCCVSIPGIAAGISALGLGFLRNDRLLFPAEIMSLILLLYTFTRTRRRHGRNAPIGLGLLAAAIMFAGLKTTGPFATVAAIGGALAVVGVVVWDWRLQSGCDVPPYDAIP